MKRGTEIHPAIVFLQVTELSDYATLRGHLPFVIDTGSPFTMIPRGLLQQEDAFRGDTFDVHTFRDVSGHVIVGRRFKATLSLNPYQPTCRPLMFTDLKVFVTDPVPETNRPLRTGLLGLDALRQLFTTFEPLQVFFRQPAPSSAPYSA